ncbi:sugar porter family MFS transporter, partial [Yunchengibacter salinarum]|uniref:sugar porter family MFS transporter n=1 Tax=Yunchengibacter salinarum TaxID=3133399 RepID=UPI0035B5E58C
MSTIVAALGGFLFGFDTAVISGTTGALESVFELDKFALGLTVAAALIGTMIGVLGIEKPVDRFGRRLMLVIIAAVFLASAVGSAFATVWEELLFYRFIGGLAVGGSSVVGPVYIAEIAPAKYRGRLAMMYQMNIVLGILVAFFSNYLLAEAFDGGGAWRWMLGVEAVPAALFLAFGAFLPQSPRWLVQMHRDAEARAVLTRLGEPRVDQELADMRRALHEDRADAPRLFQKAYALPLLVVVVLAMFNQLSGINALMYYAPTIFEQAGFAKNAALLQAVSVGGTNVAFTVLALFLIDRIGRRPLLMAGGAGMALSLAVVGWQFLQATPTPEVILAGLLVFIASFAASQGAVLWVLMSEIFPNVVRGKGQALGSFTHWTMAAVVSWTFPVLADLAPGATFGFFALMMVGQVLFVHFIVPETKAVPLEDMEDTVGGFDD